MKRAAEIAELRSASVAARTPQAEAFDRRAVCAGLAAQIAVAEAFDRKVVAIKVGFVGWCSVVAAYDLKVEPPPDEPLLAALVIGNVIGLSLACGVVPDEMEADEDRTRAAFYAVKLMIDDQPAARFMARVAALQRMTAPGWREFGRA